MMKMTRVLTGVLSVGLLAASAGGALAANDTIDKQEVEKTPYSYEHEDWEIFSEQALTQEEVEQIKIDKTEPEQALGIPAESFKGTIHQSK